MADTYNGEYYEYCKQNGLMPTDEGYNIWLISRIIVVRK